MLSLSASEAVSKCDEKVLNVLGTCVSIRKIVKFTAIKMSDEGEKCNMRISDAKRREKH